MRTETIPIFTFEELSEAAKTRAMNKHYENEDYPFLCEDLTEDVKNYLTEQKCTFENIRLLYSLSWSQGDGLCFTGEIEKDGKKLELSHNYRYCFAKSVSMCFLDEDGEEVEEIDELKTIYFDACKRAEKMGYSILEYRMNEQEFSEFSDINDYEYEEDGTLFY